MIEEPVTITYEKPCERVLFNAARDANPFFHVMEALWMLAGREDVAPLAYYAKNMLNYSDDGVTLNGAYGYRWRHADTSVEPRDQLEIIIEHLQNKPESRRAVLAMWNVEDDLMMIDESRDVCCNLSVMFSIREYIRPMSKEEIDDEIDTPGYGPSRVFPQRLLDMTVTNRSNDMIWGTLGANACHFSFLQEYMAAHLGVEVGVYNQFSNNLHVYESNWKPEEWLAWYEDTRYTRGGIQPTPLVQDPKRFDMEIKGFVENNWGTEKQLTQPTLNEPFLQHVAMPMLMAFRCYKDKSYTFALNHWVPQIKAQDWKLVAQDWLKRRINKKKEKANA